MLKSHIRQQLVEQRNRVAAYNKVLRESDLTFRELNSSNIQATLIQIEDFWGIRERTCDLRTTTTFKMHGFVTHTPESTNQNFHLSRDM